ncbi:MAG: hypothetical protein WKF77_22585 [Planctomycetaceae bacterium]
MVQDATKRDFALRHPGYSRSTGNYECLLDSIAAEMQVRKTKICDPEVRRAGDVSPLIVIPAALPFYLLNGCVRINSVVRNEQAASQGLTAWV